MGFKTQPFWDLLVENKPCSINKWGFTLWNESSSMRICGHITRYDKSTRHKLFGYLKMCHEFPIVFHRFSHGFPMFSHGFPMFSQGFPVISIHERGMSARSTRAIRAIALPALRSAANITGVNDHLRTGYRQKAW